MLAFVVAPGLYSWARLLIDMLSWQIVKHFQILQELVLKVELSR